MIARSIILFLLSLAATAAFSQQSTNEILRDIKRQGMSPEAANLDFKLEADYKQREADMNIKKAERQREASAIQNARTLEIIDGVNRTPYTGNPEGHAYECKSKINPGNIYLSYGVPCPSGTSQPPR